MTDKTNNKNLEEKGSCSTWKEPIQNPNTWTSVEWRHDVSTERGRGYRRSPLTFPAASYPHSQKVLRRNPLLFVSAPSLTLLPSSKKDQPLRCHSTSNAAWPTSQVLAPMGKYVSCSRCSFSFTFRDFPLNHPCMCIFISDCSRVLTIPRECATQFDSILKKKMQTHLNGRSADFSSPCWANRAYTSSLSCCQVSAHWIII